MTVQLHNHDAEVSLLAACADSKVARTEARRHITGGDFYEPRHEVIWDAMARLDRHGKAVNPTTINATIGTATRNDLEAKQAMTEVLLALALPDDVADFAAIVRSWATKRRIQTEAAKVQQEVMRPDLNAAGYAASVVTRFAGIRDSGVGAEDTTAVTVAELLAEVDDAPDWIVPGLLERRDRLMLTGEEGLGKSHLLRQIALCASSGLNPFDYRVNEPVRTLLIDCENSWSQVRRKLRPTVDWLTNTMRRDPTEMMMVDCTSRMDITRDKDVSRIHQIVDAWQPAIVVIGPLYRLVPRALQTDDDTAPVLAALDTIRDRGCALLMEAHAGHAIGKGGVRDLRPRGSSSLLGWPEFGFGLRGIASGYADVAPWRGQREQRDWPDRIKHSPAGLLWQPTDESYAA